MLNKVVVAAGLLAVCAPFARAADNAAPQQFLDSVLTQHDFVDAATVPYVLEADFKGQGAVPMQGHLRLQWQTKDHWRSRLDLGPFQEIRIRNGEMEYTLRNYDYTPLQVNEFFSLFGLDDVTDAITARKMSNRTEAGVALLCVQGRFEEDEPDEVCVDRDSHDLVSNSWDEAPDQSRRQSFSDYVVANGIRYPRELDMYLDGSRLIEAHITNFQPAPFDPALLMPPKDAIERRKCAALTRPIAIKKQSIDFGVRPGLSAEDMIVLTIETDGSVGDIRVVQSGGAKLDGRVVEAFKNWKFKPAMCGDVPVLDEVTAVVDYRVVARTRTPVPDAGMTGLATVRLR